MNRMTQVVVSAAALFGSSCGISGDPAERPVRISTATPAATFEKLRALPAVLEVAASSPSADAAPLRVLNVSTNWCTVSQNRPLLGREFLVDEGRVPTVAILSYDAWQRLFGKDPGIVGRTIDVGVNKVTVVGILPRQSGRDFDVYLPWSPSGDGFSLIALLRPGVTLKQAQAAVDAAGIKAKLE
jgi:hypothetical protein